MINLAVRMRATPVGSDGRLWLEPVDIFLHNPRGEEMRRWPTRNAANGPIEVEFPLGNPTLYGEWSVSASARTPAKFTKKFQVLEYNPVGFELEVKLSSGPIVAGDEGLSGTVQGFSTIGSVPTRGVLTMTAIMSIPGISECERPLLFVSTDTAICFIGGQPSWQRL